jgi:hypothetical protein
MLIGKLITRQIDNTLAFGDAPMIPFAFGHGLDGLEFKFEGIPLGIVGVGVFEVDEMTPLQVCPKVASVIHEAGASDFVFAAIGMIMGVVAEVGDMGDSVVTQDVFLNADGFEIGGADGLPIGFDDADVYVRFGVDEMGENDIGANEVEIVIMDGRCSTVAGNVPSPM